MQKYFKINYLVNVFLLICVLSTNQIIIYNEELLVALSFFLFVAFVGRYFGNNIKESLDSSSQVVREIYENLTNSKQHHLQQLKQLFEKSINYENTFLSLKTATRDQLSKEKKLSGSLWSHFYQQWLQKSSTLIESKRNLQPTLVDLMSNNQLPLVITRFSENKANKAKVDKELLSSVIRLMAK